MGLGLNQIWYNIMGNIWGTGPESGGIMHGMVHIVTICLLKDYMD